MKKHFQAVLRFFTVLLRLVFSLLLIGLAIGHSLWPSAVGLDWPTVSILVIAWAVFVAPETLKVLPWIKRIKWGDAEVELAEQLRQAVESSEIAVAVKKGKQPRENIANRPDHGLKVLEKLEDDILSLASKDKKLAIVRLAMEIEQEVNELAEEAGWVETRRGGLSAAAQFLETQGIFTQDLVGALNAFYKVRSQVVHGAKDIPDTVLDSTLDSGLRLLRVLRK